jgi:hypothetical protein
MIMATKKNGAVKFDVTKGDVGTAIEKDVAAQVAGAKATWATMRRYVELNSLGKMPASEAKTVLLRINVKLAEHRKANHDPRPVAPLQDSRISEFAGILRMGEWSCWPTVFDHLKDLDVNKETLNTVSKFIRKTIKGDLKKNASACPPREKIMREINRRKASRRGNGADRNPNAPSLVRNPENNLLVIKRNAKGLAKWFGKEKGRAFMDAILKAVESATSEAKRVAKAREAAEA